MVIEPAKSFVSAFADRVMILYHGAKLHEGPADGLSSCTDAVRLDGRDVLGTAPERIAQMGLVHVSQGDPVCKYMTIPENLLVGGYATRPALSA